MVKTLTLGFMPDEYWCCISFNSVFQESKNVVQRGMDGIDALVLWGGRISHHRTQTETAASRINAGVVSHPSVI